MVETRKKNINGYAKWTLVVIAVFTILYNTIATHVIAKNEIEHVKADIQRLEQKIDGLQLYLMSKE